MARTFIKVVPDPDERTMSMTASKADRMVREHLPLGTRWVQVEHWLNSKGVKSTSESGPDQEASYRTWDLPGRRIVRITYGRDFSYHQVVIELFFDAKDALVGHEVKDHYQGSLP